MYSLKLEIKDLPEPINRTRDRHWSARKRRADYWHTLVAALVGRQKPAKPLPRARLVLTRFSSVCPDWDGLASTWKHPIDGLVRAGVLEDDCWRVIGMPELHWEKAPPKQGSIRIEVYEAADPA